MTTNCSRSPDLLELGAYSSVLLQVARHWRLVCKMRACAGGVPMRARATVSRLAFDNRPAIQIRQAVQRLAQSYGLKGHRITFVSRRRTEMLSHPMVTLRQPSTRHQAGGTRDFEDVDAYREFLQSVVAPRIVGESSLGTLYAVSSEAFTDGNYRSVTVKSDCIISVMRNSIQSAVSSRWLATGSASPRHSELWYRNERMEVMPRLRDEAKS